MPFSNEKVIKICTGIYSIYLGPSADNKKIYDVKCSIYAVFKIKAFLETIFQHHRSEDFRHIRTYYIRIMERGKCGLDRWTKSYTKTVDTLPKCVNCLANRLAV